MALQFMSFAIQNIAAEFQPRVSGSPKEEGVEQRQEPACGLKQRISGCPRCGRTPGAFHFSISKKHRRRGTRSLSFAGTSWVRIITLAGGADSLSGQGLGVAGAHAFRV